jgi:acetyl esterase/lipase
MKSFRIAAVAAIAVTCVSAAALAGSERAAIPLYSGVAPGSEGATQVEGRQPFAGQSVIVNVTKPTLTPVLPDKKKATGAAVIVAPGGGFKFLSIETEGFMVARWLADHGIAAFVLKYRVDPTPSDPEAFKQSFMTLIAHARAAGPGQLPPLDDANAVADGKTAMKLVRQRAADWGVDAKRVGFIGFSAGSITALHVVLADEADSLPDFAGLIYGTVDQVAVPGDAPPAFIAFATNDQLFGGKGFGVVDSWIKAKRPVELHMYESGGHGFGMRPQHTSSDHWVQEFYWWLEARGLLKSPPKGEAHANASTGR